MAAPGSRWLARIVASTAVILSCLLLASCDGGGSPASPAEGTRLPPSVEVQTMPVKHGTIVRRISAPGSVLARRESRIGPEVRGRIERVFVSEGDRVEAGDPLFEIEPTLYATGLRRARAGLDLARAERRQVEADQARAQKLKEQNIITEREIDRLETQLAVAKARERQAAELATASKQDLERCVVHAPYAGTVAARLADEGTTALVQPQTIVIVLQETEELEAHATIPESQLQAIQVGDRALLRVEGLAEPIETTVSAVGDTIDPATRTYLVKMRVSNADRQLKAGVFAQVEILPEPRSDVLLVPREAVRTEEGRTRVMTIRDGRVEAVLVAVGVVTEDQAEIRSGIEAGTPVIVGKSAGSIAPGMRVRVASDEPEPAP